MRCDQYKEKMSKVHDPFDVYFARAKLDDELAKEQAESRATARRGSLPHEQSSLLTIEVPTHHRRALSCKLPARKRSRKSKKENGSKSKENSPPSDAGNSLHHSSSAHCVDPSGVSMNYVTEATLRAPSPRMSAAQKCQSAPHSRSSSWKNKRRPRSNIYTRDSSSSSPEPDRSRNSSITQFEEDVAAKLEELKVLQAENSLVVRNFSLSSKGVINRGDSFKRKPASASTTGTPERSLTTTDTTTTTTTTTSASALDSRDPRHQSEAAAAVAGACSCPASPAVSRVLVIGDRGVGKTALLQQFMTSQYMGAAETSFGKSLNIGINM